VISTRQVQKEEGDAFVPPREMLKRLAWPAVLHEQMDKRTEIGSTMQSVLGADIAAKLRERNLRGRS